MREEAPKPVEPEQAPDEAPEQTSEIQATEDSDPFGIKEHGIRTPDQLVAGGHRKIFGELKHEVEVWMDVKRRPENRYEIPEAPKRGRPKKSKAPTENPRENEETFPRNRDGP